MRRKKRLAPFWRATKRLQAFKILGALRWFRLQVLKDNRYFRDRDNWLDSQW